MCKYIPCRDMLVGTLISVNASNNPAYGKTAFISFAVLQDTCYQIKSMQQQNTSVLPICRLLLDITLN